MLKSFLEMRAIDVSPYCEYRKEEDKKTKKEINIPFLPWEQCLFLLHDNGATRVDWQPVLAPNGSLYFSSEETVDKNGRVNGCYFVKVEVKIDDDTYYTYHPVMNGTNVVYKETINQLRVNNAIQRAYVKCVAVHTGLGISLWEKGDETSDTGSAFDDPFNHDPLMTKAAIEQAVTAKLATGISNVDLLDKLGLTGKQYKEIIRGLENARWLLGKLKTV